MLRAPVIEIRNLVAILVADVVGYSRLAGTDEERTLARLRALRSDLVFHGRIVNAPATAALLSSEAWWTR
jgi:adenylate cyclase